MSNTSRFTLLEKVVLAGVVALGIGAAIPFGGVLRDRKYINQMKVELRAVATQQDPKESCSGDAGQEQAGHIRISFSRCDRTATNSKP